MILSTGEVLADVPACGPDDVDRAVTAARRAFDAGTWSRLAPAQRKAVMLRFADGIEANLSELARLDAVDAGKPIVDCEELDLPDVVNTFRWYAEAVDKVYGKIPTAPITPMAMHSQNRPELLRAAQVSVGPLGVITAQVFLAVARYLLRNQDATVGELARAHRHKRLRDRLPGIASRTQSTVKGRPFGAQRQSALADRCPYP